MHDLIIRNGTVVDGSGNARVQADVAIDGNQRTAVGRIDRPARRTIDATGCLVTPGWVDVHTHYDGQATWDPILAPSSWHGVTTVVMGNCGVGFAPVRPGQEGFLIELMEGVEDIPGSALAEGIDWRWETFAQYLDALEELPRAIDIATQVPHGAVRAYVMGERCNSNDDLPTEAEIAAMAAIVRDGIKAGALGFSSSRTLLHKDKHGVHVPGTFAGSDEMLALGLSMKGLDHGVFELVSDHLGSDDEWAWVRQFAAETGRPVTLVATSAGAYEGNKMFNIAEEARRQGIEVRPQMAGRPTGVLHGLQSNFHIFMRHPTFAAQLKDLPLDQLVARMQEPATKAKILAEHSSLQRTLSAASLDELLWQIFPLGEKPNYEPDRADSVAGIAQRDRPRRLRSDVRPARRSRRQRTFLPAARRLSDVQLRFFPGEHAAPEHHVRTLRRRRSLRCDRRRRHADVHPHALGTRSNQRRAVAPRVSRQEIVVRHCGRLRHARSRPARARGAWPTSTSSTSTT